MTLIPGQVSVVVPVFNDADNLGHCLSSLIRAREELPVDILVVDDGSSDSTPQTIRRVDVRHVRSEHNLGQSWARNHGAALTESKYILFIDSDVVVYEGCFQLIDEFIAMDKPKGLIGLQGVFSLEHPFQEWSSLIYNTLQHLLSLKPRYNLGVNTAFFLVARQDLKDIGGFREDMWFMEDNEFGQRMAARGKYVLHGPVQFVHRKRVTWSWLIRTHILGGKMQRVLAHIKPAARDNAARLPVEAGVNRVFLRWLLAGIVLSLAFVLSAVINHSYSWICFMGVAIITYVGLLSNCSILLQVNPNPAFFVVGMLTYMFLPWLIVLGRLIEPFSSASERDRKLWKGRKISS